MDNKDYFDRIAGDWDSMRQAFFSDRVRDKALKTAGVGPGKVAADIGAGTGFITQGLLAEGLRVIAVDHSANMLKQMASKFGSPQNLDLRVGEGDRLPIDDRTVDYVFANMYLHHVESPPAAIAEMARILKPGGTLVITDLDEHSFEFLRTEQHDRWLGFKRTDLVHWMTSVGLENATTDCAAENCCSKSETCDQNAQISIFVASARRPFQK